MKRPEIKLNRKLTNGEVFELYNKLSSVRGLSGVKLLYAVDKTKRSLKNIAEAFAPEKLIPKPEKFIAYENEVREKANALRDRLFAENPEHSSLIIQNGRPELSVSSVEAQELINEMQLKHKKAIADYQKEIDEYNVFMSKGM